MFFNELLGNDNIKEFLNRSIESDKISHSYIFEGHESLGKFSFAMEYAKQLLCSSENMNYCLEKVDHGNHPDLKIIEIEGKSIKNKQIESFQEFVQIKPYEAEKKVVIINDAEKMTTSAQNRILKVLEEPPSYGVIILVCKNSMELLPTIKSRCQLIKFNRVGRDEISKFICDKYSVEEEKGKVLSILSDGAVGKAIELVESKTYNEKRDFVIGIPRMITEGQLKVIRINKFLNDNKENISEIFGILRSWLRDLLFYFEIGESDLLVNIDYIFDMREQLKYIDGEKLIKYIKILDHTEDRISRNVNFNLAIDNMLLNWQEV